MKSSIVICFVTLCCVVYVSASSAPNSDALSVEQDCANRNTSCDLCAKSAKCLWCNTDPRKCIVYPSGQVIPSKSVCKLGDARWGVCWVNYKVLLIAMGCAAGVLLIAISCCIYCCCCHRKKNNTKYVQEEARFEREREDRQARNAERRAERQSRVDDIRAKYGLGGNIHIDPQEGRRTHKSCDDHPGLGGYGGGYSFDSGYVPRHNHKPIGGSSSIHLPIFC